VIGCRLPIQLAGMPRTAVPERVAPVSGAGGLGMLGGARYAPQRLAADLDGLARSTDGPFGVTFPAPSLEPELLEIATARARVVELFWGAPAPRSSTEATRGAPWSAGRSARSPKPGRPKARAAISSSSRGSRPAVTCAQHGRWRRCSAGRAPS